MSHATSKAARLAQLDREIVKRVQEIQTLIRPGDEEACLYTSNLRTEGDRNDIISAAVGNHAILAGLLAMRGENDLLLAFLPTARELIAQATR